MIRVALLFIWVLCLGVDCQAQPKPDLPKVLNIHIFCQPHGGLGRDCQILKQALERFECNVECFSGEDAGQAGSADINIFCESLYPQCYSKAKLNWFIPNPEWYRHDLSFLEGVDLVLCRTHEVQRIFNRLQKATYFLGFTSFDHYDSTIEKNYECCLHLAGASWQKGTFPLLHAWERHPEFGHLTIIKFPEPNRSVPDNVSWINYWLPEEQLRRLQNACGIHLCLSESEGYGHYIAEAMAAGAVVITTDAPPMNEFITDSRCLVPYSCWRIQKLGVNYYLNVADIEARLKQVFELPEEQLRQIGRGNRRRFLKMKQSFLKNLEILLSMHRC